MVPLILMAESDPMLTVWWAEVGSDFWMSGASVSGRNHPPGQTQGQHAVNVFSLARRHWRRLPDPEIRSSEEARRSFLRAAAFHDVGKRKADHAHDWEGYCWMREKGDLLAAFLILTHMGRWLSEPASRPVPSIIADVAKAPMVSWMVHTLQACDYTDAVCFDLTKCRV